MATNGGGKTESNQKVFCFENQYSGLAKLTPAEILAADLTAEPLALRAEKLAEFQTKLYEEQKSIKYLQAVVKFGFGVGDVVEHTKTGAIFKIEFFGSTNDFYGKKYLKTGKYSDKSSRLWIRSDGENYKKIHAAEDVENGQE